MASRTTGYESPHGRCRQYGLPGSETAVIRFAAGNEERPSLIVPFSGMYSKRGDNEVPSEIQTQPKLYLPRRPRTIHDPESRTVERMARHQEIRVVQHIEELAAELERLPLRQTEHPDDRRIHVEDAVRAH